MNAPPMVIALVPTPSRLIPLAIADFKVKENIKSATKPVYKNSFFIIGPLTSFFVAYRRSNRPARLFAQVRLTAGLGVIPLPAWNLLTTRFALRDVQRCRQYVLFVRSMRVPALAKS